MAAPQYETLYGVGLLDDIHNYFPAILYDSSRFRTTQDLLHYIQTCTRNRFDLFSFGQRAYISNHLPPPLPPSPSPSSTTQGITTDLSGATITPPSTTPQTPDAPTRRRFARRRSESPPISLSRSLEAMINQVHEYPTTTHSTVINLTEEDLGFDSASSLLNLVNLLGGFAPIPGVTNYRGQQPLFDDVVVTPTQEQIDATTTRIFPTADTPCSICQDTIASNQMARQLNHCKHMFHISCIDEWFARDVHCPVCRHDIRDIDAPHDVADTSHP